MKLPDPELSRIRPRPLKHARALNRRLRLNVRPLRPETCSPMTICIAALCRFAHGMKEDGSPDMGLAIVTATDRMFTDAGLEIEYETGQGKWANFGKHTIMLVADSMPIQSEIIRWLRAEVGDNENITPREVADLYSKAVIKFKREEAEKLYLAPYGLSMESFVSLIQSNNNALISDLAQNILDHSIAVDAIVTGVEAAGNASIYHIDNKGIITSHVDVAFLSIGSGHYHSNAFLTSRGYWNEWTYYNAVCAIYAAKKQAEHAPGVGILTDMLLITKNGWSPVDHHMRAALDAEYPAYLKRLGQMEARMTQNTWKRMQRAVEKSQAEAETIAVSSSTDHK